MSNNQLKERINIIHPIIQAPMAGGICTAQLVADVSNAGGVGSIAGGYLTVEALKVEIEKVQKLTEKPYLVNLFVPEPFEIDEALIGQSKDKLLPFYQALSLEFTYQLFDYQTLQTLFLAQISLLIKNRVPIASFTFGFPSQEWVAKLKAEGIFLIGTATTIEEALLLEGKGADAVVLQGSEAGGHRGGFLADQKLMPLLDLLKNSHQLRIPIIAAGGIMDQKDIKSILNQGADAVQMGSAFLLTIESGATDLYRQSLLQSNEKEMVLTRAFSGKWARGINNTFMKAYSDNDAIAPFPIQNSLTAQLRQGAALKGESQYLAYWGGMNAHRGKIVAVNALMKELTQD